MTIALRASGAWAAHTTSPAAALPAGVAAGDMMILFIGCKPYTATIATPAGWTALSAASGTNGTTASGVDIGSVQWATFYRIFVAGDAAPTLSVTSGNPSLAVIRAYTKTATA